MTIEKLAAVSGDVNAAIAAERLRIMDIVGSAEGRRNPELAIEYADAGLDAETAKRFLAKAPAATNPFLAYMDREGPIGLQAATLDVSNDPKAARQKEIRESMRVFNNARRVEQGLPPIKD